MFTERLFLSKGLSKIQAGRGSSLKITNETHLFGSALYFTIF